MEKDSPLEPANAIKRRKTHHTDLLSPVHNEKRNNKKRHSVDTPKTSLPNSSKKRFTLTQARPYKHKFSVLSENNLPEEDIHLLMSSDPLHLERKMEKQLEESVTTTTTTTTTTCSSSSSVSHSNDESKSKKEKETTKDKKEGKKEKKKESKRESKKVQKKESKKDVKKESKKESQDSSTVDTQASKTPVVVPPPPPPPSANPSPSDTVAAILKKSVGGFDDFLPTGMSRARLNTLLEGLKAEDDESRQMECLLELCDHLVMATEETLANFRVDSFVPALVHLLNMEHNPEIMLLAARGLTFLMEALPASCATIVRNNAVPMFCDKLLTISYIDLAEQSLQALEKLSYEHPTAVLRAGGLMAVLSFLDFFALSTKRAAVATASNICRRVPNECFDLISAVIPNLTALLNDHDQKVVENAILCFARLADSFGDSENKLEILASQGLLGMLLRLISSPAPLIGGGSYTLVLRLLTTLCHGSSSITFSLMQEDIASTLKRLCGPSEGSSEGNPMNRSPEQIHEILCLINELLPSLPRDVAPPTIVPRKTFSRISSSLRKKRGDESDLTSSSKEIETKNNARIQMLADHPEILITFNDCLFENLLKMFTSTVNPSVRHKCLVVLLKLIHFSTAKILKKLLKNVSISSFIATLLASRDLIIAVTALRMAEILMQKLPSIFSKYFKREGVLFEVEKWASQPTNTPASPTVTSSQDKPEELLTPKPTETTQSVSSQSSQTRVTTPAIPITGSPPTTEELQGSPASTQSLSASSSPFSLPFSEPPSFLKLSNTNTSDPTSSSPTIENYLKTYSPIPTSTEELKIWLVTQAKSFKEKYFETSIEKGEFTATEELKQLRELTSKLFAYAGTPNYSLIEDQTLQSICSMFTSAEGIPTFELLQSEIISALLQYLSASNVPEESRYQIRNKRLRAFCEIFFKRRLDSSLDNDRTPSPFSVLLRMLQDALNSVERFPVLLNDINLASGSSSGLSFLTQPFKLKLQRFPGDPNSADLKDYSSNVVLIEPLATVNAIEEFLWPRVKPKSSREPSNKSRIKLFKTPPVSSSTHHSSPTSTSTATPSEGLTHNTTSTRHTKPTRTHPKSEKPSEESSSHSSPLNASSPSPPVSPFDELHEEKEQAIEQEEVEGDNEDIFDEYDEYDVEDSGAEASGRVHDVQLTDAFTDTHAKTPPSNVVRSNANVPGEQEARSSSSSESESEGEGETASKVFVPATLSSSQSSRSTPLQLSSSKSAATTGQNPREMQHVHQLTLSMGSHVLPYTMTIFQAIQKLVCEQAAAAENSQPAHRMWEAVYTISYRKRTHLTESQKQDTDTDKEATSAVRIREITRPVLDAFLDATISYSQVSVATSNPASTGTTSTSNNAFGGSSDKTTHEILGFLRLLEALNKWWPQLYPGEEIFPENVVSANEFVNEKLTSKLMRQLQDPLTLCSGSLPEWCRLLTQNCPFLFPFECRRLYFYSTSFGIARALQVLQQRAESAVGGNEGLRLARIQRQKVRVLRSRILDSAVKVMELFGRQKAILEVEYFGEVGTGLGPTLEFYTLVSHELQKRCLRIWIDNESLVFSPPKTAASPKEKEADGEPKDQSSNPITKEESQYVLAPHGLFPVGMSPKDRCSSWTQRINELFRFMGIFIAKAMLDSRLLDLPFAVPFFKWMLGEELSWEDLIEISPSFSQSFGKLVALSQRKRHVSPSDLEFKEKQRSLLQVYEKELLGGKTLDDIILDFTFPGSPSWELIPNGANELVTLDNVEIYCQKVVEAIFCSGIQEQLSHFREGFDTVFPMSQLRAFSVQELQSLLLGQDTNILWDLSVLMDNIKCDHGYSSSSRAVEYLLELLCEMTEEERRKFLQFVTGSPRLPVGGFKNLHPKLTIVRKDHQIPDDYLPTVSSCFHYLKLPDYSSKEIMRERLLYAIHSGQQSFDLT